MSEVPTEGRGFPHPQIKNVSKRQHIIPGHDIGLTCKSSQEKKAASSNHARIARKISKLEPGSIFCQVTLFVVVPI
jgi:hypothetical protein